MIKKIMFLLLLMTTELATAGEKQWHWVMADNLTDKWNVEEGMADVTISGVQFQAKLYWKDDPKTVKILLKGMLKNGKLKVIETRMESDQPDETYAGTYLKEKIKSGIETIILSDTLSMIGLVRAGVK